MKRRDDTGFDHEERAQWALQRVNRVMASAGILPEGYELCYDNGIKPIETGDTGDE